jgi:glycosyltransferase involved in cell wall biosynthesis
MKKNSPLVSIIMNCHNGEKYLKKSLQSILNQTYKNWELIFWDNQSKDKSEKIFKSFKNSKFKYFYSKNFYPLYKSRNLAIKKAKGRFITFLDTDDLWQKDRIKYSVNYLLNKKLNICYSNHYLFYQKIKFKKKAINYDFQTSPQYFLNNYNIGILTVTLKKTFFKKESFNSNYQIIGDFDYFIKLSLKNKIGYIKKPLATYRIHGNNYSLKNTKLYIKELNSWIQKNQKLMNKNNLKINQQKKNLIKLKFKQIINYYKLVRKL